MEGTRLQVLAEPQTVQARSRSSLPPCSAEQAPTQADPDTVRITLRKPIGVVFEQKADGGPGAGQRTDRTSAVHVRVSTKCTRAHQVSVPAPGQPARSIYDVMYPVNALQCDIVSTLGCVWGSG